MAIEGVQSITTIVEDMHRRIGGGPAILGTPLQGSVQVTTGLLYGGIRRVAGALGYGLDQALTELAPHLGDGRLGPRGDAVVSALNGVLGDYLEATENPLAIGMEFRRNGEPIDLTEKAIEEAGGRLLVLVHGSSMNDRLWQRRGHDHGASLARDLGYTPVYLRYNTGRHVSINGDELAERLETLLEHWPVPVREISLLSHSMGGLVARSACGSAERGELAWRRSLRSMVFLGTPHHGAPLEQAGSIVNTLLDFNRYSAPLARLGKIRSAGVTDLRYGNVLEEHWRDRDRFELGVDRRTPLPLPDEVSCFAVAGQHSEGMFGGLRGDGLVSVDSALGRHKEMALDLRFPENHTFVAAEVGHLDLLSDAGIYDMLRQWLS